MRPSVEFRPEAWRELHDAVKWCEAQRVGLGSEFLHAIGAALEDICSMPAGHALVAKRTRKVLLRRFSYSVFYALEGDRILVTGIFHTSRDPRSWSDRAREVPSARALSPASTAM